MESTKKKQTTGKNQKPTATEWEQSLAKTFGVNIETIRLVDSIVKQRTRHAQTEPEPIQKNEVTTNDLAEQQILGFFKDLSFESKLAVVMTQTLLNGDHGTGKLMGCIVDGLESEILEKVKEPKYLTIINKTSLTERESILAGVVLEQLVWHKYL